MEYEADPERVLRNLGVLKKLGLAWGSLLWYQIVRWSKFGFLWVAIVLIVFGAMQFYYAL
jgi:hypothetical protein